MAITDALKSNDPAVGEKTLQRIQAQDEWNDIFATKLFELLDKIDGIRADVRGRLASAAEVERLRELIEQAGGAIAGIEESVHGLEAARRAFAAGAAGEARATQAQQLLVKATAEAEAAGEERRAALSDLTLAAGLQRSAAEARDQTQAVLRRTRTLVRWGSAAALAACLGETALAFQPGGGGGWEWAAAGAAAVAAVAR